MCHHCNCNSQGAGRGELPVITPHNYPYSNPYGGAVLPRGNSGAPVWGLFLLGLGILGGGFGLAIGSGLLAFKGAVVAVCGFIRVCSR